MTINQNVPYEHKTKPVRNINLLGSWIFPATALAFITIGEIVWLSSSDAAFTTSLNLGSSEFSTSRLATRRMRLALRAILVAPATSIWGWWLVIATRHLSRSFFMASSEASSRDLVSMASSTKPRHPQGTTGSYTRTRIWNDVPAVFRVFTAPYLSFFLHCQSTGSSWFQNVHMLLGCRGFSAKCEQQIPPNRKGEKKPLIGSLLTTAKNSFQVVRNT